MLQTLTLNRMQCALPRAIFVSTSSLLRCRHLLSYLGISPSLVASVRNNSSRLLVQKQ